ncbi:MAG: endo-1,4-beta-xylanase [Phycisphaerae bacterium]
MHKPLVACWLIAVVAQASAPVLADDNATAAAKKNSPFGIHGPTYSHWLAFGHPNLWLEGEARFRLLVDSGAGWARQDFWWGLVEPEQGKFAWDDFDRAVEAYQRHGMNLMAILCYASAWSGGVSPDNDGERARFANYVYQMVKRYRGRVAAWEIWNEPNIQPFWSPRPGPGLYTKLLQAAYTAAKKADPGCVIVGGALAGPDHAFLKGMYEAGAKGYFDVFSYHNYGQHLEISTEWPALEKLRAVMAEYGDVDKPIWHTETGFYTGPAGLSEPEQAARIVRYSVGLLALGIERTFQLTLADWTDDPKHHDQSVYRGLTHADYRVKPSHAAYQTMCRRLGDKRFTAAIRPAPGVSGYLFEGGNESVLVLWREAAEKPAPVSLNLGLPIVLVQQMGGDWQIHRDADGVYELTIGRDPVYLLNVGPPITKQRYVQWPNPVRTRIPRAADALMTVKVANPTSEALLLRLYPHRLASVRFEVRDIPPGAETQAVVPVDASQLPPGKHEFFWTLSHTDAPEPFAQGFRRVEVESPLSVSFDPLNRLRPAAPVLAVRVAYSGTRAVAARVALHLDGERISSPVEIELRPGQATRVELPLDLRHFKAGRNAPIAVVLESQGLKLTAECRRSLIPCPRAPPQVQVDGDLGEWRERRPQIQPRMMNWEYVNARRSPAAEDLSVSAWVAYDDRGLWVAVEAQDDKLAFPQSRAIWNWDSLQVGLDLGSDGKPGTAYDENDLEIELGYKRDGPDWCYLGACPPGWPQEQFSAKLRGIVRPDEAHGTVAYELLIPAELLVSSTSLEPDTVVGFSILVNDNDGDGRAGWLELTPGIGLGKRPSEFAWLWLK